MSESRRMRSHPFQTARIVVEAGAFLVVAALVASSAVSMKKLAVGPAFVAVDSTEPVSLVLASPEATIRSDEPRVEVTFKDVQPEEMISQESAPEVETAPVGYEKYFDGRPIRVARKMWMEVTAYSPDWRSCPGTDDGYTATNHSVWTNAMRMVAADTDLLRFGSLVSVPGYADGEVVPVLDRGGAIKGRRLDVLYPTHEIARKWGRQRILVTVWEYADGKPVNLGHRKRG